MGRLLTIEIENQIKHGLDHNEKIFHIAAALIQLLTPKLR